MYEDFNWHDLNLYSVWSSCEVFFALYLFIRINCMGKINNPMSALENTMLGPENPWEVMIGFRLFGKNVCNFMALNLCQWVKQTTRHTDGYVSWTCLYWQLVQILRLAKCNQSKISFKGTLIQDFLHAVFSLKHVSQSPKAVPNINSNLPKYSNLRRSLFVALNPYG